MSFVLVFALQCLLPIFDSGVPATTGISLVNLDTQPREFTVTATNSDGTNSQTARVTLNAGTERAQLLKDVIGSAGLLSAGWLRVDSAAPGCGSYLTSETLETLTGTDAGLASTNLFLSHISVNTGFTELGHTDTLIAIVNPNSIASHVTLELFGLDGKIRRSTTATISAQGSQVIRISEAFDSVLPNNGLGGKTFEGYIHLNSDQPIAAWQRVDKPGTSSLLRGKPSTEIRSTDVVIAPHFVFGGTANYESVLRILNPTTTSLSLELTARDDRGRQLGSAARITMAPAEARRDSIGPLFQIPVIAIFPPPVVTGYVRIREAQGQVFQLAGDIEISTSSRALASMLYPVSDTASTSWTFPFGVSRSPYFTGFAVVNPNELLAVQTDVQVEVLNSDGVVVSKRTIQLSPSAREAALVPAGLTTGYVRLTSNFPIHVMGSIGTLDLRVLDQLPPIQ